MGREQRLELQRKSNRLLRIHNIWNTLSLACRPWLSHVGIVGINIVLVVLASRQNRPISLSLQRARQQSQASTSMHDLPSLSARVQVAVLKVVQTYLTIDQHRLAFQSRLHIRTVQRSSGAHCTPEAIVADEEQQPSRTDIEYGSNCPAMESPSGIEVLFQNGKSICDG